MPLALSATLSGFLTGLSLILAIGAQNAFVLRQGLLGHHRLAVVLTCALSDALLIALGVAGITQIAQAFPAFLPLMRYGGAAFLLVYAALHFRAAWRASGHLDPAQSGAKPLWRTVATCLALTWGNPHVYLDTLVLVGSLATGFAPHAALFGLGAICASFVFFFALGFGAQFLRPVFRKPRAWQVLDVVIGITMAAIAFGLLRGA
ncbi:Arginine exporter protein ArgO [Aquimixticola soesokkakensis]|uniref:Arginine exporter protein ArgO n=1 Tax=Aquimixticola soesokkakensis TaxID=1519096 RepID=A0A1Y5T0N0_9RHOB|nr:LysE/ArgO family amino acid transporter [Aquimixticola soesokkakensis]SLN49369.1 Arginine exporter protein ArgO [Aquimixticola soesokkakensis]